MSFSGLFASSSSSAPEQSEEASTAAAVLASVPPSPASSTNSSTGSGSKAAAACQDISNRQQAKGAWGSHVQSEALKAKAAAVAARAASKAGNLSIEMGSKLAVKAAQDEAGSMSATRWSLKKKGKRTTGIKRPKTFDTLCNDETSQESTVITRGASLREIRSQNQKSRKCLIL